MKYRSNIFKAKNGDPFEIRHESHANFGIFMVLCQLIYISFYYQRKGNTLDTKRTSTAACFGRLFWPLSRRKYIDINLIRQDSVLHRQDG